MEFHGFCQRILPNRRFVGLMKGWHCKIDYLMYDCYKELLDNVRIPVATKDTHANMHVISQAVGHCVAALVNRARRQQRTAESWLLNQQARKAIVTT